MGFQAAAGRRLMSKSLHLAFVDLTYIDPFVDQTCYVFDRMFGWTVSFGRPRAKADENATHDITGMIPLYGAVAGKMAVSLPRRLACTIASRLLQKDVLGLCEEAVDAMGELANTIAGRAAASLGEGDIRIGLPEVVVGRLRPLNFAATSNPLVVEMDVEAGCFALEIGLVLETEASFRTFEPSSRERPQSRQMF
jgi:CheY-specific phosphatase CheX